MNPRLKELYYSKTQTDLAKKLSLRNKMMSQNLKKLLLIWDWAQMETIKKF